MRKLALFAVLSLLAASATPVFAAAGDSAQFDTPPATGQVSTGASFSECMRCGDASESAPDLVATLFQVFKESLQENAEDRRYWMGQLETRNALSDAIADYQENVQEHRPNGDDDRDP